MRTVDYSDVLQGSLALAGIPIAGFDPASDEFALMRTFHDRRLRLAWEAHSWPDVCRYEQRSFRPPWDATMTYAAGDEVLDIPTLTYVQALQASTNQAPTTAGVLNQAYWAPCQQRYTGDDYDATRTYAVGDMVRNPADNQFYQCISLWGPNVLPGGAAYNPAGVPANSYLYALAANADYLLTPEVNDNYAVLPDNTLLTLTAGVPVTIHTTAAGNLQLTTVDSIVLPVTATLQGVQVSAPPSRNWGLLTPFQRVIEYQQTDQLGADLTELGEVFAAFDHDPRLTTRLVKLPFRVQNDGFLFTQLQHTFAYVWLHYRLQRPTLTGALWSATAVYTAGRQVYFADATTGLGNFFTCLGANVTGANSSPAQSPGLWAAVALPYIFREYLVQGAYADWLTQDGQGDKAAMIEGMAQGLLELEADKLQRQQQQTNRLDWRH